MNKKSTKPESANTKNELRTANLDERLSLIENHLNIPQSYQNDDYNDLTKRIRHLEDRLLYLESLSPEYYSLIHSINSYDSIDTKLDDRNDQIESIQQIDDQIQSLLEELQEID